jgi:signal peptidase I
MNTTPKPRNRWTALGLSFLCTGLGQIYCGRIVRGLVLFLASLLFVPAAVFLVAIEPSRLVLSALLAVLLAMPLVYLFAAYDAFRIASRAAGEGPLLDFQIPLVYVLFSIVGVLYPVGSLVLLRADVVEAYFVPTRSMEPAIRAGDRILVEKIPYLFEGRSPRRWEVVAFGSPDPAHLGQSWIKRIVGFPGEEISVRDGELYIDGARAEDPAPPGGLEDFPDTVVPPGCVWVLGDCREDSKDSREFGGVPLGNVLGPVRYVFWPAGSLSRFGPVR